MFNPENIRDVAVVGHQGSGKTSLVESLAYKNGVIEKKGSVEKKDTISDYLPMEKERQVSMASAVVPIEHDGYKINLIDLPGNDDFIFETIGITRLIKGAILVIDASKGVQTGTVKAFKLLKKRGVPMFLFLNKMDKENVDFNALYEDIKQKLDDKKCVPFCYPIGRKENFDGFVNVVELKARKYNGVTCEDDVIYEDKREVVYALHNRLCEAVATVDDAMLERFFSGEPFTNEEIKAGLRQGVLAGELYPILVGSATKDIGINTLTNMLISYLPAPNDLRPYKATTKDGTEVDVRTDLGGKVALQVFKNAYNSYQGLVSVFKVQSGVLRAGDTLFCPNNGKEYQLSNLFQVCGEKLTPVKEVGAGDIAAATRLEDVRLSYTLSDKNDPVRFREVAYPTPTYFTALVPETKKDSDKLFPVVARMSLEDPTILLRKEETTGQILLGGLSKTHLSTVLDRLRDEQGIRFSQEKVRVSYRETITKAAEAEGRFVKQTGGSGYYGVVQMRFEPAPETAFASTVFGGHIDKGYFPAVQKGFEEALQNGGLLGAPVIKVKATLLDGKQHSVDSNEMAFKNAAILAFRNAYDKCEPVLLEPYDRITIDCESDYLGAVLSDLTKRRARILSTDENKSGNLDVVAIVPQAEILEYANELKALSKGTAFFNLAFEDYEQVPSKLQEQILKDYPRK